jgi:hypothetical protein
MSRINASYKEVYGDGPDAPTANTFTKQILYYAIASVTPIKGRAGLPALRALCEEDED